MRRTISVPQYLQAATRLRGQFVQARDQLTQLSAQNQQQMQDLNQRAEAALADLTAAILPELQPAALERAVQLTGYVPLTQSDPISAMERSHLVMTQRIAEIEADRRFRDRLLLRAPRIGLISREIAELEEFRTPLQDLIDKCQHERLPRLLQSGYGTPAYSIGFWRMSYYADWRAADEICERFANKRTFAELAADYRTALEAIAVYDGKLEKLHDEVRQGELLEQEHSDLQRKLAELPQTTLQDLRGQLGSYMRDMDLVAIGDRLTAESQIDGLAKRYLGLRKQISYLRDSGQHLLRNTAAPVNQTIQSLDREILKYQRPKFTSTPVPMTRLERLQKLEQRCHSCRQQARRYEQAGHVIYTFTDYAMARLDDDFLWWDLMTYSFAQRYDDPYKVHGYFIPEVANFHAAHPDYRYKGWDRDDLLSDAEARAAAASVQSSDDRTTDQDIS